ncbi:MAG: AMP-binding protein, partial [Alphaproteobacteria bacterium]
MGSGTRRPVDYAGTNNLAAMFFEQAERIGEAPLLWSKRDGWYQPLSGREVAAAVRALARGLTAVGVEAGDRVLLVSENRPEWLIADIAILTVGAITVPGYTTNTVADHLHLLNDATPKVAIASVRPLASRLLQAAGRAEVPPLVVAIDSGGPDGSLPWSELLARGAALDSPPAPCPGGREDTACIIYTSGTGGLPKGVRLSHGNILHNCRGAYDVLSEFGLSDEVFLSFLPLSHSYEHTAGQFFPLSIGAEIYYAEGIDRLVTN